MFGSHLRPDFNLKSLQKNIVRLYVNNPLLFRVAVASAIMLTQKVAAEFTLTERPGDMPTACESSWDWFKGFAWVGYTQCDRTWLVAGANRTIEVYAQLVRDMEYWNSDGAMTKVQHECIVGKVQEVFGKVADLAEHNQPPLPMYPDTADKLCIVRAPKWKRDNGDSDTIPTHDTELFFGKLNPVLCRDLIDIVENDLPDCESNTDLANEQAKRGFIVCLMIIGIAAAIGGILYCWLNPPSCPEINSRSRGTGGARRPDEIDAESTVVEIGHTPAVTNAYQPQDKLPPAYETVGRRNGASSPTLRPQSTEC